MATKKQKAARSRFAKQAKAKGPTKIGRRANSTARQPKKPNPSAGVPVSPYERPELPYSVQPAPLRRGLNRPPRNGNLTTPRPVTPARPG
jgi:hypothetical protein